MKWVKRILIGIVVIAAIIVGWWYYATDSASKLTEYDFGTDKIRSINAVIGETRKVTGVSTGVSASTSGSSQYKQYDYETASMGKDLTTYWTTYLQSNGWTPIKDFSLNASKGEMQIAKESADSGKILIMLVEFEQSKYTIKITKGEGTLTRK